METRIFIRKQDAPEEVSLKDLFEYSYTTNFPIKLKEGDKVLVPPLNKEGEIAGTREIAPKKALRVLWVDFDLDPDPANVAQNVYIQ